MAITVLFALATAGVAGGAICNSPGAIINSTVIGNMAGENGGGLGAEPNAMNRRVVQNCIFANNTKGAIIERNAFKPSVIEYCLFFGNPDGDFDHWGQSGSIMLTGAEAINAMVDSHDNIDGDPLFVDAGFWDANSTPDDANDDLWVAGDYHLQGASACIDAGDPNFAGEPDQTDIEGNRRVVNGRVDIGAYEMADPVVLLDYFYSVVTYFGLHGGVERGLLAKLDGAIDKLEDGNGGNDAVAINLLRAFINSVEGQRGKKILVGDADAMVLAVEEIIELLGGSVMLQ